MKIPSLIELQSSLVEQARPKKITKVLSALPKFATLNLGGPRQSVPVGIGRRNLRADSIDGSLNLNKPGQLRGGIAERIMETEISYNTSSKHEWESDHDGFDSKSEQLQGEIIHEFKKRLDMKNLRADFLRKSRSPTKLLYKVDKSSVKEAHEKIWKDITSKIDV